MLDALRDSRRSARSKTGEDKRLSIVAPPCGAEPECSGGDDLCLRGLRANDA